MHTVRRQHVYQLFVAISNVSLVWLLPQTTEHPLAMKATNSPRQVSPIVRKGLDIILQNKQKRQYLKWGTINVLILSLLLIDITNKCPYSYSNWYYVEYAAAIILSLSIVCYLFKFLFSWITFEPVKGTAAQQKLLHFDDGGNLMHSHNLFAYGDDEDLFFFIFQIRHLSSNRRRIRRNRLRAIQIHQLIHQSSVGIHRLPIVSRISR